MSPAPQDPRPPPPLLQTVCQAGLITLAALMADHAHQLPRPQFDARPVHRQVTTCTHHHDTNQVGEAESTEVESGSVEPPERPTHLPALVPPTAPIYSFDEDGDILPLATTPETSHQQQQQQQHQESPILPQPHQSDNHNDVNRSPSTAGTVTHLDDGGDVRDTPGTSHSHLSHALTHHTHRQETTGGEGQQGQMNCMTKEKEKEKEEEKRDQDKDVVDVQVKKDNNNISPTPQSTTTTTTTTTTTPISTCENLPRITVKEAEVDTRIQVPRINFHAGSVEAEEDYLEEEHQLRDFCVSLLGEAGWGSTRACEGRGGGGGGAGGRNEGAGLLSVTSQDPNTAARKAQQQLQQQQQQQQRVPFSAVVFSERKPSTGDALVLSLGLGADGASTIADIASKNQGVARERIQQQGEQQVPGGEAKLTRQCESCGVSPEDCLKRLGLHSDASGSSPAPSPKSERVLHFFRQLQGDTLPRPPNLYHRCHHHNQAVTSDPEFECGPSPSRPHSRSLASSPTIAEDDGRKSRLVAL